MSLTGAGESHFIPDQHADPLMAVQRSVDQLMEIVDRYDLYANGNLLQALATLRKRTATHLLTVAVFSASRQDRSSLIRTLLNTTLETASIPPSAAACTYLAYGARTECAVTLANSMTAWLPLERLTGFVSEKATAANLKKVLVRLPNAALERGLMVIDTPELTGDPEALLSCTADAVAQADACVFVLPASEELKENAISFLRGVQGKLEKFFFVLDGSEGLSGMERERSLERVSRFLEQRCGLLQPRVSLLPASTPAGADAKLERERAQAGQTMLLDFASVSWQSVTSNEVARVAGEMLTQAGGALNRRETAPLERVRLRRMVKALDGISRQAAGLALASDEAMRNLAEVPKGAEEPAPVSGDWAVSGEQGAPAAKATPLSAHARWGTLTTTGTIPSFTGASIVTWVAAQPPAPLLAQDPAAKDTTAPPRAVPVAEPAMAAASPARGEEPRLAEIPADRPAVEPAARSFEWCSNRFAFPGEDDEDEFASGGGRSLAWRVLGGMVLLAALLVIAWAAMLVARPQEAQIVSSRVATARLTAVGLAKRIVQSGRNAITSTVVPPVTAPAVTAPATAGKLAAVAPSEPVEAPPSETPPSPKAPSQEAPSPKVAPAKTQPQKTVPQKTVPQKTIEEADAAAPARSDLTPGKAEGMGARSEPGRPFVPEAPLQSVLSRWIEASRRGDIQAQAACYAPVVATYFNSRNLTRQQVQLAQERASEGKAGVQNYHITTIGISDQGGGRRAVLLQKDWDTPTGSGPAFAGTEIERLVFAPVAGEWKIVGEQEVNLQKLPWKKVRMLYNLGQSNPETFNLERFVDAQAGIYATARAELEAGRKRSHWMWFIFPQIAGLGSSPASRAFAISSAKEAAAYLAHPILGPRLRECVALVNAIEGRSIPAIFPSPDDLKFHSCVTLFADADAENAVFTAALEKYFSGKPDQATLKILRQTS